MDSMEPDVIEPGTAIALLGPTPLNPVAIFQPGGVDDLLTRIKAALMKYAALSDADAKAVVIAIATSQIPAVKIEY